MVLSIEPNGLFAQLSKNASTRKKRSLEIIHNICNEQYERGSKDFSIPTIAPLSVAEKGPSEQTIRNKEGQDYRALMQCWAEYANGTTKKTKPKQENTISEILAGITDPTIRALVGVVLAENRKLKGENSLLKRHTKLTIDMRPSTRPLLNANNNNEALPQVTSSLLPSEITALQNAISDEFLKEWDFTADEQGRIKYKGRTMYKAGYLTAIKKILSSNLKEI
jgi:hypothetical protein